MKGFSKFILAFLGFFIAGSVGGLIGFGLGYLFDEYVLGQLIQYTQTDSTHKKAVGFEINVLFLAAVVIKVDGNINQRELHFVRNAFLSMYGKERANSAFKMFKSIIQSKSKINTRQVCLNVNEHMQMAERINLLRFLFNVAKADGQVGALEVNKLKSISNYLYISSYDFESVKRLFYKEQQTVSRNSYAILGLDNTASNEEIKSAYRKLVKKYHPDKIRTLTSAQIEASEEKFREVQKAYEKIQLARGM
ncbi:TerB family tellurite resistance protein [Namhaeicola litoreus]|uniref:TerB family tellurite resistance protein n=1 Tax=Namhaeicola litoreus TaxID=1052145 RepID=A0ABW3XX43_9FLAO